MSCASELHIGLPVIHNGLYVMCEGLLAQIVCLSCAMTAIMTHVCHNDIHDDVINAIQMQ